MPALHYFRVWFQDTQDASVRICVELDVGDGEYPPEDAARKVLSSRRYNIDQSFLVHLRDDEITQTVRHPGVVV